MTEPKNICPGCGKPVAPSVPLGLCPGCLVKSGFSTGTEPGAAGKRTFEPPPVSELAKAFPQFEIISLIGQGGMGAVYKAKQPALDRLVALKILPPEAADDPGFAERFNREARALARLNHPNIVAIHDFGRAEIPSGETARSNPMAIHYLLMEFVDGANLRQLERAGRMSPDQALRIIPQICDALQFAHDEGVVHRDIKPENILLNQKGRVKITDFGIAKIIGAVPDRIGLTGAKDIIGTPHYMAPEQMERPNAVDHRADIYSLGVVFYELLTGELPLGKFAVPSSKVQVDVRLDSVVLRALEKEPERRYQQAGDVKTEMQTIATTPPIYPPGKRLTMPVPATPPVSNPHRYGVWIAIGAVAILVFIGVAAISAMFFFRVRSSPAISKADRHAKNSVPNASDRFEPKTLTESEIRDVLIDLRSSSPALQQIAASKLALTKPSSRRDEVETQLLSMLDSSQWPTRQSAARALGVWGSAKATAPLAKTLGDSMFSVRWAAIEALGKIRDPQAIMPLTKHLGDGQDVSQTSFALQSFGVAAEDSAATLLTSQNREVRCAACRILRETGSQKSIPALTTAASDPDGLLAMLAKDALKAIDDRRESR